MFAANRFRPLVIVGMLFCTVPCFAQSQRDMVCQGSCGGGCGPCSGSSSGGSRSHTSSGPSAAQIAAQKAHDLNAAKMQNSSAARQVESLSGRHFCGDGRWRSALGATFVAYAFTNGPLTQD